MFGDSGRRRADIIVRVEVIMWCFLSSVRHFSDISVVCGGRVIDDKYTSRMYTYRLSRDITAIKVASMVILRETILFRISHFGINPERGGSPPRDKIAVDKIIMMYGELVHIVPISLIVVDAVVLIIKNTGIVVMV